MNKVNHAESEEPPSRRSAQESDPSARLLVLPQKNIEPETPAARDTRSAPKGEQNGIIDWLKAMVKGRPDTDLREALEEYIEAVEADGGLSTLGDQERVILSNILKLRDLTVVDVMIPRADIVAVDINSTQSALFSLLAEEQYSRFPVFRETLDDVVGTIHIKDILGSMAKGQDVNIAELVRDVPIVAPSMAVLDLLLMMKQQRRHIVLVVDEYGGIDGLATIGDVIEAIVGSVDDEYDEDVEPQMTDMSDGSVLADARLDIDELEKRFGEILTDDEREDIDTLGGLVFALAGRIPVRGQSVSHSSGLIFEVVDADPRRLRSVLIKNIPLPE